MAKKRGGRYPKEFRRMAVERLENCDNILAPSRELSVHRRLLYKWRDQLDPLICPRSRSAELTGVKTVPVRVRAGGVADLE